MSRLKPIQNTGIRYGRSSGFAKRRKPGAALSAKCTWKPSPSRATAKRNIATGRPASGSARPGCGAAGSGLARMARVITTVAAASATAASAKGRRGSAPFSATAR